MVKIPLKRIQINTSYFADLTHSNWSPIIQHSGIGDIYWNKLFQYFPEFQLFYENKEGEWLGFANTIPIRFDGKLEDLPEEGWDWLIETGITGYEKGVEPNILGGLQIGVHPRFRCQGWSKRILEEAKSLMSEKRLDAFILPIRPTLKDQHPEVPMEEYMKWEKDGKVFDPWIRTHLNAGASVINVCHRAMTIEGSINDWKKWTNEKFEQSGKYQIAGGLSMVDIDLEKNKGTYLEPNIWISYH